MRAVARVVLWLAVSIAVFVTSFAIGTLISAIIYPMKKYMEM